MNDKAQKHILIVLRQPPYGSSLAREALDAVLATAVFEQKLTVLFTGDGVWQLPTAGDSGLIDRKSCAKAIAAFPLYDLKAVYIDSDALQQRNLATAELAVDGKLVNRADMQALLDQADTVLSF